MIQALPGTYGTKVNLLLVKLGWSATKDRTGLALPEALTITMIKGNITYGGPAVLDDGVRGKLGHGVYGVRVFTKVLKSLRCSSENVGFWLVFCMFAPESYLNHND